MSESIPAIVDFSSFSLSKEFDVHDAHVQATADQIVDVMKTYGCVYLINHGIQDDIVDMRLRARSFFQLPRELKEKSKRPNLKEDIRNGWANDESEYKAFGGDLKESFNMHIHYIDKFPWPDDRVLPGFREGGRRFIKKLNSLGSRLMQAFGPILSPEDPDIFTRAHVDQESADGLSQLRCLYYPPLENQADENRLRHFEHFDYDMMTLVMPSTAGLETKWKGDWHMVEPVEGAILLQAGIMLEIWTAGKIKAPVHRVVFPKDERRMQLRESAAYFFHPDGDFEVRCLDGSDSYEPTTTMKYLRSVMK